MIRFLMTCGPYGPALVLLGLVNGGIFLWNLLDLLLGRLRSGPLAAHRVRAHLFWGGMAVMLGFLGQANAFYKALHVIREARVISPRLVALGLQETFSSAVLGLGVFGFSLVLWGLLKLLLRLRAASSRPEIHASVPA